MKLLTKRWMTVLGLVACLGWLSSGTAQDMELPGEEVSFEISPMVDPSQGEIFEAPQDVEETQDVSAPQDEPAPQVPAPAPAIEPPAPVEQTDTVLPAQPTQESEQDVDAQPSPSDVVVAPQEETVEEPAATEGGPMPTDVVQGGPVVAASCCQPACAQPVRVRTLRRSCCDPCGRRVRFIRRRCR